tara:strand:- start:844 stop:1101 length:258 start_codon:yes stop_codon:yes gene_type:complete
VTQVAGWIVASLVVVVFVLVAIIHITRRSAANTFSARRDFVSGSSVRDQVVETAQGNLNALRDTLESSDPGAAVAAASDSARERR